MSKKKRKRLPSKSTERPKEHWEDSRMGDGISLEQGSAEYKERVRDLQGINEHEQERVKKTEDRLKKKYDLKEYDEDHKELVERNEKIPRAIRDKLKKENSKRMSTTERNVSNQVYKASKKKAVMNRGRKEARKTETKDDDKRIERRLPKTLDRQIYDEGVSRDDYYPGMKTIEKFL